MEDDKTTQESSAAAAPPLRSLADYAVGPIPTLLYVPGFISDAEQSQLLHHVFLPGLLAFYFLCVSLWSCGFDASGARGGMQIYQAPAPKWKSLKNRRLQNWGACYSLLWSLIPRLEEPLFFPFPFALQWARFWVFDWIRFVGFCRRSGAWEGAPAAGMWVYSNQSLQILAQLCGLSSVIRQDIAWLKWYEFRGFVLCD